jgi:hypothetical protein
MEMTTETGGGSIARRGSTARRGKSDGSRYRRQPIGGKVNLVPVRSEVCSGENPTRSGSGTGFGTRYALLKPPHVVRSGSLFNTAKSVATIPDRLPGADRWPTFGAVYFPAFVLGVRCPCLSGLLARSIPRSVSAARARVWRMCSCRAARNSAQMVSSCSGFLVVTAFEQRSLMSCSSSLNAMWG